MRTKFDTQLTMKSNHEGYNWKIILIKKRIIKKQITIKRMRTELNIKIKCQGMKINSIKDSKPNILQ
jgi:hypothetical protein